MRGLYFIGFLLSGITVFAQPDKKITRVEYIEKYKDLAMEEMKRTGIPASITLAQGLLESGNGNSRLAIKANNHFGIKCHEWNGASINHDDDKKDECFRKYKSAEQSYRDHSDFLTSRTRYALLFDLKSDDYKGWAKGLKSAGYATSPTYAKDLIKVIEDNELYKFDQVVLSEADKNRKSQDKLEAEDLATGRRILFNNRVKYIIADSNDTYEKLTEQFNLLEWQLPRYNDVQENSTLKKGDYVYLQPKRNRASFVTKVHIVKAGEDLHSIAQIYGVKEEKLRERNRIPQGSEPNVGVAILLRGKVRNAPPATQVKEVPVKVNQQKNKKGDNEEPEFIIEYDLGE
jgi:LysM repeat protein